MPETRAARARVAVLISGRGTNLAALLYASRLPDCPYEIVLVASNDPQAGGLAIAEVEGIKTFALSHRGIDRTAHDDAMDAAIRSSGAEYVALAGYMRILGDAMVARWSGRMVNIHPSLLPLYPGLDTHARAIEAGDSHGGATVHLVTSELDNGEPLGRIQVAILPGDTPDTLAERVLVLTHTNVGYHDHPLQAHFPATAAGVVIDVNGGATDAEKIRRGSISIAAENHHRSRCRIKNKVKSNLLPFVVTLNGATHHHINKIICSASRFCL